jgi:hypothetical protein
MKPLEAWGLLFMAIAAWVVAIEAGWQAYSIIWRMMYRGH